MYFFHMYKGLIICNNNSDDIFSFVCFDCFFFLVMFVGYVFTCYTLFIF